MEKSIKMKAVVIIKYLANPYHYQDKTPEGIARTDQSLADDGELLTEDLLNISETINISITPDE